MRWPPPRPTAEKRGLPPCACPRSTRCRTCSACARRNAVTRSSSGVAVTALVPLHGDEPGQPSGVADGGRVRVVRAEGTQVQAGVGHGLRPRAGSLPRSRASSRPRSSRSSAARAMLSSSEEARSRRVRTRSMPVAATSAGERSVRPATASTVRSVRERLHAPCAQTVLARTAATAGALPCSDCPSREPSPTISTSASATAWSKSAMFRRTSAPERARPPRSMRAWPVPPAAPAPGREVRSVEAASISTPAARARSASSSSRVSAWAPFWAAKTCAAPCGPVSGEVTSEATVRQTPCTAFRASVRSAEASDRRAADPSGRRRPSSSVREAPRAASMPRPRSVEALPPMPTTTSRAPSAIAAARASPSPRVLARAWVSALGSCTCCSPQHSASSTTATSPRRAIRAVRGSPSGPETVTSSGSNPAASAASTVPSPPSATGTERTCNPCSAAPGCPPLR